MLIAQITDLHIGFEPGNPAEFNRQRLDRVVDTLRAMTPQPDLLLVTGDISDQGDDGVSYAQVRDALSGCAFPIFHAVGNHDSRAPFREHFSDMPSADGFVQYAIEHYPVRILVLDTLDPGRHSGNFCETRAAWLRERLAEETRKPTLIALHHPPIETGLSWMTEDPRAEWVNRLRAIVSGSGNIVAMIAGHLHRPAMTRWAGTALLVCPSTAPQVALDLDAIDPEQPDGRPMIVADPPGYALHWWNGEGLVSHFDTAEDHVVIATYTPALQPLVRLLARERGA